MRVSCAQRRSRLTQDVDSSGTLADMGVDDLHAGSRIVDDGAFVAKQRGHLIDAYRPRMRFNR